MKNNITYGGWICKISYVFFCKSKSVTITRSLELGPDSYSDERTLQTIKCSNCKFEGIALYEESRKGGLDNEPHHHYGYKVTKELYDRVCEAIDKKNTEFNISDFIKEDSYYFFDITG